MCFLTGARLTVGVAKDICPVLPVKHGFGFVENALSLTLKVGVSELARV